MNKDISDFFASAYNLTSEQYAALIEEGNSAGLFSQLYGHTLGLDGGAVPVTQRSSYYESIGIDCLPNKLISYQKHSGELVYKDRVNDYIFNSDGYRSNKDYDGTEELVVAGCSQTLGEGVPEHATWGTQVATTLGVTHANISRSGASVYWIVDAIFGYLRKYKAKPKMIVALMPEFHRVFTASNPLISIPYVDKNDTNGLVSFRNQWIWEDYKSIPKYLKRPFPIENSMSLEMAFMLNLRAMHSLEAYCEAAGINFIWGTWSPNEEALFLKLEGNGEGLLDSYIDLESRHWHSTSGDNYCEIYHTSPGSFGADWSSYGECNNSNDCRGVACHQQLEKQYGDNFHLGTDWPEDRLNSHFGVHRHTHLAETFLKAVKDIENSRD